MDFFQLTLLGKNFLFCFILLIKFDMDENCESITEAQLEFALKLLQSQHKDEKSIVFSPVSIAIALATVYLGTQGDTEKQIRNALGKGSDESAIHAYFTTLLTHIKDDYGVKVQPPLPEIDPNDIKAFERRQFELAVLNDCNPYTSGCVLETFYRAYVNEKINLKDDFVKKSDEFCKGGIESVNFEEAAGVVEKINNFIAEVTRDKITNIVSKDDFNEMSKIVLINAIYFKGRWSKQFYPSNTNNATFYMAPGKTKKAKMMHQNAREWQYSESNAFQFLTLHYQYNDLSMRIILPKKRYGLADVMKNLTAKELMEHLTKNDYVEVIVKMPKFDIKTEFDVVETLKTMGIKDLFDPNKANLEGMSDSKPIMISSILHSAYIYTDEEGTEAAAITRVHLLGCANTIPPPPIKFTANHPFIYLITDSMKNIYFCGVVSGAEFKNGGSFSQAVKNTLNKSPVTSFANKWFGKKS